MAEAYSRFGALVVRRCRAILRDPVAAEDAMQDTFVKLWRYGASYREAASKVGWLYQTAQRCCFDRMARGSAQYEVLGPLDSLEQSAELLAPPSLDAWETVQALLSRLDERSRQVAVLYHLDEMTQEEIADELGISRQTVYNRLKAIHEHAQRMKKAPAGRAS